MTDFLTSSEDFLTKMVAGFRSALPTIEAVAPVVEEGASVLGAAVPATAPYIAGAEGAIASATKIAPVAIQAATSIYDQIENLLAVGGAEIQSLKALFTTAAVANPVGQIVVATPATTAATVPASAIPAAPGAALS